ncbi:unnamed protein product, partial [marine sediment metagenome]
WVGFWLGDFESFSGEGFGGSGLAFGFWLG